MKMETENAFELLIKPIQEVIKERGFTAPTEPQNKAIPLILEGKNVLLIAPTATGKTEAAILPIFNNLLLSERKPGIKILYITPLRALNRDLLERIHWWGKKLDIKIGVRHGDTEASERTRQSRDPPDMLITTPETLQVILIGFKLRKHLKSVKWVIVDEVHEMADSKRGSQLSIALERLRWIIGGDFQIVGLSATIGSPEEVAKFLVGVNRECEIVKVPVAKEMKLKILFPKPIPEDYELASIIYTHPEVAARLRVMRKLIEGKRSVLLFTNTRAISEVLASRFKVWDLDFPISIHHGSLSKVARIAAEEGLKRGEIKSIVCTSSLELGIDIGSIDMCIQYNSPRQVTRLLQRIGRSGHRIGRMAEGIIIALDSDDALEAMVIGRRALKEDLEEVKIPDKPYDALIHQIAGIVMTKKRIRFNEIYKLCKNAYPYRNLTIEEVKEAISYMYNRYPRLVWASFDDEVAMKPKRRKELFEYYFENLSMIPDEKRYLVIDETNDMPVGLLDEAFVAEYGEPGVKFICRGTAWKVVHLYKDRLYVRPVSDPTGAIPSWVGEEIPVPFEVAMEVGEIRRFVEESLSKGMSIDELIEKVAEKYPVDKETAKRSLAETIEHFRRGLPMPTDKRIVIESWKDYIIIHASFGTLVNRNLARIVGHVIAEGTGYTVGVQQDPYRIVLLTYKLVTPEYVGKILRNLAYQDIEELTAEAMVKTGLFKRRLLHVAKKLGALPKHYGMGDIGLRGLLKSFEGTIIFTEALKDMKTMDVDVERTTQVLKDIKDGKIELAYIKMGEEASPLALIGIERIERKMDLIPAERMHHVILESIKARLLNEARTFVCTSCWKYAKVIVVKNLPDEIKCPICNSSKVGLLEEPLEDIESLLKKGGKATSVSERNIRRKAVATADLISEYGKPAAIALCGKRMEVSDAKDVLREACERLSSIRGGHVGAMELRSLISSPEFDSFYELIVEREKLCLKRRFS